MSQVQDNLLKFIIEHVEERGYQPSYQEIGEHFGVSKQAVSKTLKRLAKDGRVVYQNNRDRSLILPGVSFKRV